MLIDTKILVNLRQKFDLNLTIASSKEMHLIKCGKSILQKEFDKVNLKSLYRNSTVKQTLPKYYLIMQSGKAKKLS